MADVIIFGQQVLKEKDFLIEIKKRLEEDGFQKSFQTAISRLINMVKEFKEVQSEKGRIDYKTIYSEKAKIGKRKDAQAIFYQWEYILNNFISPKGEKSSETSLLVIALLENETIFSQLDKESDNITKRGVSVKITSLSNRFNELKEKAGLDEDADKMLKLQYLLQEHYKQFLRYLNCQLSQDARNKLVGIVPKGAAKDTLSNKKIPDDTYYNMLFKDQRNQGKQTEAFMSHIAQYHNQLLRGLKDIRSISINDLKITDDWGVIFAANNVKNTWSWLSGAMNSRPWFTGGDIIVLGDDEKIAYNIQIKSAKQTHADDLSLKSLIDELIELRNILISNDSEKIEKIGKKLFEMLKTETVPAIEETYKENLKKDWIPSQFEEVSKIPIKILT